MRGGLEEDSSPSVNDNSAEKPSLSTDAEADKGKEEARESTKRKKGEEDDDSSEEENSDDGGKDDGSYVDNDDGDSNESSDGIDDSEESSDSGSEDDVEECDEDHGDGNTKKGGNKKISDDKQQQEIVSLIGELMKGGNEMSEQTGNDCEKGVWEEWLDNDVGFPNKARGAKIHRKGGSGLDSSYVVFFREDHPLTSQSDYMIYCSTESDVFVGGGRDTWIEKTDELAEKRRNGEEEPVVYYKFPDPRKTKTGDEVKGVYIRFNKSNERFRAGIVFAEGKRLLPLKMPPKRSNQHGATKFLTILDYNEETKSSGTQVKAVVNFSFAHLTIGTSPEHTREARDTEGGKMIEGKKLRKDLTDDEKVRALNVGGGDFVDGGRRGYVVVDMVWARLRIEEDPPEGIYGKVLYPNSYLPADEYVQKNHSKKDDLEAANKTWNSRSGGA